jgi:hypothetical protein
VADNTTIAAATGGDVIATDDIGGGVKVQRVKVGHGSDGAYTDAAAATPLPVATAALHLTGSATAVNVDLIPPTEVSTYSLISFRLVGTFAAAVELQGSHDGVTWLVQNMTLVGTQRMSPYVTSQATASVSTVQYMAPVLTRYIRVRTTSYTSGTVTINLTANPHASMPMTYVTNPAAEALAVSTVPAQMSDTTANPAANSLIGALNLGWDGAWWRRLKVDGSGNLIVAPNAGGTMVTGSLASGTQGDLIGATDCGGFSLAVIRVTGSWGGANVYFEGSNDAVNWFYLPNANYTISSARWNGGTGATLGGSGGLVAGNLSATPIVSKWIRVRCYTNVSATMSATMTLLPNAAPPVQTVQFAAGELPQVDTELPAAVALTDTLGNPSTPIVGSAALGWDGSLYWRRVRVNAQGMTLTAGAGAPSWGAVRITAVAANTAYQGANTATSSVTVKAHATNAGTMLVGSSAAHITGATGVPLGPGDTMTVDVNNTNLLYVGSTVAGDIASLFWAA